MSKSERDTDTDTHTHSSERCQEEGMGGESENKD